MTHHQRVQSLAKWLLGLTILSMILLPVILLVFVIMTPMTAENIQQMTRFDFIAPNATQTQLWLAFAVQCVPGIVLLWALNQMRQLFVNYRLGEVLTDHCAQLIQRTGYGFLVLGILPLLTHPLQSVLLSWANPAGERVLSVGVTNNMIGFGLMAGLLIVVGWAMRDASAVAAENRTFI